MKMQNFLKNLKFLTKEKYSIKFHKFWSNHNERRHIRRNIKTY